MSCELLAVPLQTDIVEKVKISPLCSEVKVLLEYHYLLVGCSQKAVERLVSLVQISNIWLTLGDLC